MIYTICDLLYNKRINYYDYLVKNIRTISMLKLQQLLASYQYFFAFDQMLAATHKLARIMLFSVLVTAD